MGRNSGFTTEEKLTYIHKCTEDGKSVSGVAKSINVNKGTLEGWIRNYASMGINGLEPTLKSTVYTKEFKKMAVEDYLGNNGSLADVCKKYKIRSTKQLRDWLLEYNNHEELKSSKPGEAIIVTNGRKTTYEERIEIIKYCIEHQNNYIETAKHFQVSYYQVHSWVAKYKQGGVEALEDRRGKRKSAEGMSAIEKLKVQNKLLQAENKRKQMEIDFLKKLNEIEGSRY